MTLKQVDVGDAHACAMLEVYQHGSWHFIMQSSGVGVRLETSIRATKADIGMHVYLPSCKAAAMAAAMSWCKGCARCRKGAEV